jgi:hypothetical protein
MMFFKRPQISRGLTILESLVVLFTSFLLIVTLVPVILVQMGIYKLPEPEITPKPIVINGREVVDQKKTQPSLEPTPAPKPSPASATPAPPAKAPESSAPPPDTSKSNKPPVPPMLEPSATSGASTKP